MAFISLKRLIMEIRPIKISDADNYHEFQIQIHAQTNYLLFSQREAEKRPVEFYQKTIGQMESDNLGNIIVALDGDKVVGSIWLGEYLVSKRSKQTNFGLGVFKEYHKQGVAQQLFDQAEQWIKEKGFARVEITVFSENIPAYNFYMKNGFEQEGLKRKSVYMNNKFYDEIMLSKLY